MHFKYNLLIVFEIEEFNFILYCRNKCILRRLHHYYCFLNIFLKTQYVYYISILLEYQPALLHLGSNAKQHWSLRDTLASKDT